MNNTHSSALFLARTERTPQPLPGPYEADTCVDGDLHVYQVHEAGGAVIATMERKDDKPTAQLLAASWEMREELRQARSEIAHVNAKLADAVLGWACSLLEGDYMKESEVSRHIRDFGGQALAHYASLSWKIMGARYASEGDLLVGYADDDGDPVLFDLCSCERVANESIVAEMRERLRREQVVPEPLHDTLEEATI